MGQFYKLEDSGNWLIANKVYLPSGTVLSVDNKISEDGWYWFNEEPFEYIEYLESLENEQ